MNKYITIVLLFCCLGVFRSCEKTTYEVIEKPLATFGTPLLNVNENMTPIRIPVSLSHPAPADIQLELAVKAEDGAVEGVHYSFYNKKITISQGATAGYFELLLIEENQAHADRIFYVELVDAYNAVINAGKDVCKVVITSAVAYPTIGFEQALMSVDEDGGHLFIPIVLSKAPQEAVSFSVRSLVKWDAVEGEHYALLQNDFTIPVGENTAILDIEVIDDLLVNENRIVEVEIYDVENANLSQIFQSCKVTIVNDDRLIYASFAVVDTFAFKSDVDLLSIPIAISGPVKVPTTITIGVRENDAVEGTHFELLNRVLHYDAGESVQEVQIRMIDNDLIDMDRTFELYFESIEGMVEAAASNTICEVMVVNDRFDYKQLYEDLIGEWTLTQTGGSASRNPASCTVIVSGGSTPEEEDANYLNKFICKASKYLYESRYDMTFTMSYDVNTGDIAIICGELVCDYLLNYSSSGWGYCALQFEHTDGSIDPIPTNASKDHRRLEWTKDIRGGIMSKDGTRRSWFTSMAGVVMSKKRK